MSDYKLLEIIPTQGYWAECVEVIKKVNRTYYLPVACFALATDLRDKKDNQVVMPMVNCYDKIMCAAEMPNYKGVIFSALPPLDDEPLAK